MADSTRPLRFVEGAAVTLANWRVAPHNRWGLAHMREVVPSANVARDPDRASPLPVDLRDGLGDVEFTVDGTRRTVRSWMDESDGDGLLVLRDGEIVHEEYASTLSPVATHLLFSVSKSVTGILAGLVVDRCGLSVDDLVGDVVPEAAASGFGDATIRDLLDMRVSIDYDEVYDDSTGMMARYREAIGWLPPSDPSNPPDLHGYLSAMGRRAGAHGGAFRYLSPISDMLGWVCERAAGRPFAEMLSEWVWAPMGAWCSADIAVDRLGAPRTAGGLAATLRDMGRFTEMVRNGGVADSRRVVPAAWIDDLLTAGDPAAWRGNEYESMLPPGGRYRSQWYLADERGTQAMAVGIHGQWLWFDRDLGVTVVKLSSRPDASNDWSDAVEQAMFAALASAVS
ncbi:MAG: serine hydrolase domain-containing protein [Ilumatobacteraceae bacterium]